MFDGKNILLVAQKLKNGAKDSLCNIFGQKSAEVFI